MVVIALGQPQSYKKINKIKNSMKAEIFLFSPLTCEGQTALISDVYIPWHLVAQNMLYPWQVKPAFKYHLIPRESGYLRCQIVLQKIMKL